MPNSSIWRVFENLKFAVKQCYQTCLIGQKLVENAKIENFKCDIFSNFQTLCKRVVCRMFSLLRLLSRGIGKANVIASQQIWNLLAFLPPAGSSAVCVLWQWEASKLFLSTQIRIIVINVEWNCFICSASADTCECVFPLPSTLTFLFL